MPIAAATLSVLIADDEEGIRNLVAHWLTHDGHQVKAVTNASEAIRMLARHRFDLVITDVVMPDGDGFELIGACRKSQPQARIVAISGGGQYIQRDECLTLALGLGAHATVAKPFNREQLHAGIELALPSPERPGG